MPPLPAVWVGNIQWSEQLERGSDMVGSVDKQVPLVSIRGCGFPVAVG